MGSSDVCTYSGCGRQRLAPGHKCIFHAPAAHKDAQKFRDALAREIRKWRNGKAEEWDFSGWVFVDRDKKPNLFRRAVFPTSTNFFRATFTQDAAFSGATFTQSADFSRTTFAQDAHFSHTTFTENTNFMGTTFTHSAYFMQAVFAREARFWDATFGQKADFWDARFTHAAFFSGATFTQKADFSHTTFVEYADLSHLTIMQDADFVNTHVHGWLDLRRLNFPQQSGYWPMKFDKVDFGEKDVLDLRDNDLQEHNPVIIRECNLGRILLSRTDLKYITFHASQFEETSDTFLGGVRHARRLCTGDEWVRRTNVEHGIKGDDLPTWNDVDLTYQKLAKHFRDNFNHPVANDCERGFFEARRNAEKEKGKLRGWCNYCLISVYKYASYYSGLIWLPVLWLLAVTALLGAWYELLIYGRAPAFDSLSLPVNGWAAALRIAGLSRTWLVDALRGSPHELLVTALATAQVVVTAILITLLIFAVRRRFKHGD